MFLKSLAQTWDRRHWQWYFQMQTAQGSRWPLLVSGVSWRLSLWPAALWSQTQASQGAPALGGLLQWALLIRLPPGLHLLLLCRPVPGLSSSFFSSSFWFSEYSKHRMCVYGCICVYLHKVKRCLDFKPENELNLFIILHDKQYYRWDDSTLQGHPHPWTT